MMNETDIEYLDYTWNPTHGCSPIATGCLHCWAKAMSKRLAGMGVKGYSKEDPFKVVCCDWKLDEPFKEKKPSRIGVSFMGDLFHKEVGNYFVHRVWLKMCLNARHTFVILTKRPGRLLTWTKLAADSKCWPIDEIWSNNILLGISVSTQKDLDEMMPIFLQTPASKRIVSVEPQLGDITFSSDWKKSNRTYLPVKNCDYPVWNWINGIDWVICGAESGPGRRPFKIEWARHLRDQCVEAGVPFFFKQSQDKYGKVVKMPELDGKVWNMLPKD